ncbi:hypothetical protein AAC387_Pa10g0724 [Persea americana]
MLRSEIKPTGGEAPRDYGTQIGANGSSQNDSNRLPVKFQVNRTSDDRTSKLDIFRTTRDGGRRERKRRVHHPPSSKGHRFIFAAMDYFSKWSEAFALSEMKTSSVLQFLRTNIICRFGIPKRFVHDNGPQFRDHRFYRFCDKYKIQSCPSTPYNLAANGLAEAFTRHFAKFSRKWSLVTKETGVTNCLKLYGPTELPFEDQPIAHHSPWSMDVK